MFKDMEETFTHPSGAHVTIVPTEEQQCRPTVLSPQLYFLVLFLIYALSRHSCEIRSCKLSLPFQDPTKGRVTEPNNKEEKL